MKDVLDSQSKAIDKLSHLKVGALFMEAGTGKTRAAKELVESAQPDYVLWFTPYQTKENLRAELDKWGGLDCEIVGIETISSSDRTYLELREKLEKYPNSFVISDESLKIKNNDAIRTKRAIDLGHLSTYRLILNGTPLSRNLLDLWSQLEFLSPKILGMNEAEFKNTFCEYVSVTYSRPGSYRGYTKEFIKKYHNLEYMYSLISPYVFESKLSLSVGQQHHDIGYQLTEDERTEHDQLKAKYLDDEVLMAMNNNIFLEMTQKMQHNYSLSPEKFSIVDKLLEGVDRSKVLIYAKYIDTQVELAKYYKDVRIMSLGKHAYGLNLQDYHTLIFWDKTWDYAQREQAEHRIFRTLQVDECTYYDLTANCGLDDLINDNVRKKQSLLQAFKEKSIEELRKVL